MQKTIAQSAIEQNDFRIRTIVQQMDRYRTDLIHRVQRDVKPGIVITRIGIAMFVSLLVISKCLPSTYARFDFSNNIAERDIATLQGFYAMGIAISFLLFLGDVHNYVVTCQLWKKNLWYFSCTVKLICVASHVCMYLSVTHPEWRNLLPEVVIDFAHRPLFVSQYAEWIGGSIGLLVIAHSMSSVHSDMYISSAIQIGIITTGMCNLVC